MPDRRDLLTRDVRLDDLLVASGRGDTDAFAELYDALVPRVYGLVHRILRDVAQSEEVVQEVLLQVWQTAGSFDRTRGTAVGRSITLAHSRAVDRVRSSESSRRRDLAHAQRSGETPYDETAAAVLASAEGRRVRRALAGLSVVQRRAVELAYFDGHTHTEISHLLQIPLGTAKTRIRDGLLRLRVLLAVPVAEPA